jgi:hypothetical protein
MKSQGKRIKGKGNKCWDAGIPNVGIKKIKASIDK